MHSGKLQVMNTFQGELLNMYPNSRGINLN